MGHLHRRSPHRRGDRERHGGGFDDPDRPGLPCLVARRRPDRVRGRGRDLGRVPGRNGAAKRILRAQACATPRGNPRPRVENSRPARSNRGLAHRICGHARRRGAEHRMAAVASHLRFVPGSSRGQEDAATRSGSSESRGAGDERHGGAGRRSGGPAAAQAGAPGRLLLLLAQGRSHWSNVWPRSSSRARQGRLGRLGRTSARAPTGGREIERGHRVLAQPLFPVLSPDFARPRTVCGEEIAHAIEHKQAPRPESCARTSTAGEASASS